MLPTTGEGFVATSRNSSIELLRIFAIFGIVTMHINGELMSSAQGSTAAWIQLENSLFNAGVSVFVLISGYYGIRRTWHKAAVLEITAIVYSALTALLSSMQGGYVTEGRVASLYTNLHQSVLVFVVLYATHAFCSIYQRRRTMLKER